MTSGAPPGSSRTGAAAPDRLLHPFGSVRDAERLTVSRAEGVHVFDDRGRAYLDLFSSLWYCTLGYGHPRVVEAVTKQLRELSGYHIFERYSNTSAERLAGELAQLAPFDGARVLLTSGGSEAVDSAMKLARLVQYCRGEPQRTILVSREPSYHGTTFGALALTGLPIHEGVGGSMDDVVRVPHGDTDAVAELFERNPGKVAALFVEPVSGSGGVIVPEPGELRALHDLCRDHGVLLVSDEVVTGFGRLGGWWGIDRYDVRPDMVVFAKGATSGYVPFGGVLVNGWCAEALESWPDLVLPHGYTFSGHPVACAAALATVEVLRTEGLLHRAEHIGQVLRDTLSPLVSSGLAVEVRGAGAMWALQLPVTTDAWAVREACLRAGVIVRPMNPNSLVFAPALVIDDQDLASGVEVVRTALESATDHPVHGN